MSDLPTIFESNTSNLKTDTPPATPKGKSSLMRWLPKIVFALLGVVVLVEIVLGIRTLQSASSSTSPGLGIIPSLDKPSLVLKTDKNQYKVDEVIPIKLILNTGGKSIVGSDIVIKFDPKLLGPISAQSITPGVIFQDYPLAEVDTAEGVIKISGIASISQKTFQGSGEFATINLQAKSAGNADLTFDFSPGVTSESNIIEEGSTQDILSNVNNLKLNITQ